MLYIFITKSTIIVKNTPKIFYYQSKIVYLPYQLTHNTMEELHFKLGNEAGALIASIAQEKVKYNHDVKAAMQFLRDSFEGMQDELILGIIKGDYVIEVTNGGESVEVVNRKDHHVNYPIFDIEQWCFDMYEDIYKTSRSLQTSVLQLSSKFSRRENIYIQVPIESLRNIFSGSLTADDALESILEDSTIRTTYDIARVVKNFLSESLRVMATVGTISGMYSNEISEQKLESIERRKSSALFELNKLNMSFSKISNLNFSSAEAIDIKEHVEASIKISEVVSAGIKPVNILDNYSAGWLSPYGEFYGLNGAYSNMLHINIAEALLNVGVIPQEFKEKPDIWLERSGWVKIHGNHILFAACNNHVANRKSLYMTDKQISTIASYIGECHQCIVLLGFDKTKVSLSTMVKEAESPEHFHKKYFEF